MTRIHPPGNSHRVTKFDELSTLKTTWILWILLPTENLACSQLVVFRAPLRIGDSFVSLAEAELALYLKRH